MDKALLCLLMYANVFSHKKTFFSGGKRFPFVIPTERRGTLDIATCFQYFVHQHQTEITISFPVKLGQSAHVRSSSTHQLMHEKVGLGPCDTRANEVVLGCFSASYLEVELSFYFVRRNT